MSQPRKVAQAFEHYAAWNGSIAGAGSQQIAFTPQQKGSDGPPTGATGAAVPVIIAHEILVSNSSDYAIEVTPAPAQANSYNSWLPYQSTMKPMWVDPTTFPAVTATNCIIVPPRAVAFPIRVRSVGITISSPNGAASVSVAAYGPLSLEA